ncbi:glycosyltransferase family 2 protein [Acinetobacter baumannii]|uniref:glycosyltransferase family 2 protein n=1 Tax=Acinetobacter baumannii TaxID=470 RepID=UPI0024B24C10|nr:glycosyltransferase family 2 protein [Acinetobacter baumannii]WFT52817.1 glycosyltransferase family 2 protein [Acinetobacter baumannii]
MTFEQPLISVLIPVYNVEAFVKEAVSSICNQTYKNIEIIVVDDCSTDNTYNIVAELAIIDPRIRLYKNDKNSKIVKTLNFALEQAKGEFIARMDGDDISTPERLEKQLEFLLKILNII